MKKPINYERVYNNEPKERQLPSEAHVGSFRKKVTEYFVDFDKRQTEELIEDQGETTVVLENPRNQVQGGTVEHHDGHYKFYPLTPQEKAESPHKRNYPTKQEMLQRKIDHVQSLIDRENLSPRDKEVLETVILKLRLGIDVALGEIYMTRFSK